MGLEWFFIVIYLLLSRRFLLFYSLWKEHRFITLVGLLWALTVTFSYFSAPYYSWQNTLALMRYAETFSHIFFFIILWDFFKNFTVHYRILFASVILSALVVMGYFIYIHFAFPDLEAEKHVFSMRSKYLLLNTHLHRIGYQVEAAIGFATAFLFAKKEKYIAVMVIGMLFVFLLWLGGRAAILGAFITLLLCLFCFKKNISLPKLIGAGSLAVFLLAAAVHMQLFNLEYIAHAMHKTFQAGSLDHLLTGRLEVWSLVLKELQGHWLLGTGPQSYFFYLHRHADVIHAHNFILQMLGEWGIIGTALFALLLYKAVVYGIQLHLQKFATDEKYHIAAGVVLLSLSMTGLVGGIYFFTQTSVYLALAFALWVTPSHTVNKKQAALQM